jgi:antitoxin component YwqK of YwqJK toxin-antitoxin module
MQICHHHRSRSMTERLLPLPQKQRFGNNAYLYRFSRKEKMIQKYFFILVFFIPVTLFSQVNQTDSGGLRQGKWQKSYPNGRLMYEGSFRDGKPVGEWTRYHEGGQVKAKIRYTEHTDSALAQLFDQRGKKVAEGMYVNEKKEGTWEFYSNEQKISEEEFANGVKHGISRTYYPSGELLEEAEWDNGKQEGNYSMYFQNGKPYMQCKFSNGERNGLCLSYFTNGRIEMEAYYKNNLRHGDWKFYNEQGDSLYSLKYDEGRLLNPEVRDSIDNLQIQKLEKNRFSLPDPENYMQNPTEYMMQMQKSRENSR